VGPGPYISPLPRKSALFGTAWAEFLASERARLAARDPGEAGSRLRALYREATDKISVDLHRNNAVLIDIWLEYARMCR